MKRTHAIVFILMMILLLVLCLIFLYKVCITKEVSEIIASREERQAAEAAAV